MIRCLTAAFVAALGVLATIAADPATDQQTQNSKATKAPTAASVKFRQQLGLPLPSLATLGTRIDAAHRAGDPVTLAHAAGELRNAEKVSGKQASLTSKQLMADAAKLASLRRRSAELQSVLAASDQVALADGQVAEMKKLIEMTKLEDQKIAAKEEPNAPRKVVVNNYTPQYVDIQINGYLSGQVPPSSKKIFTIEALWNPVIVKGWGNEDETVFGPIRLEGRFGTYTWNLNGDDALPNVP